MFESYFRLVFVYYLVAIKIGSFRPFSDQSRDRDETEEPTFDEQHFDPYNVLSFPQYYSAN